MSAPPPMNKASALSQTPQYHFIGGQDDIVTPVILQSYMQATPPTTCIHTMLVQEASHDDGWVSKWPELLELPVSCYSSTAAGSHGFDSYDVDGIPAPVARANRVPDVYRTVPEKPEKP